MHHNKEASVWATEKAQTAHEIIENFIRPTGGIKEGFLKHPLLDMLCRHIYDGCLKNQDYRDALTYECSVVGYKFIWVDDDYGTNDCLMSVIETPYGDIKVYSSAAAFKEMADSMEQVMPMINGYNAAKKEGDAEGMETYRKQFRARLRMAKITYFFITPFHLLLLGLRRLLRPFKRK